MNRPSLAVIADNAGLNGGSLLLLHRLRWLRTHTDLRLHAVFLESGPLIDTFDAICPTTVLDSGRLTRRIATLQTGLLQLGTTTPHQHLSAARLRPQLRQLTDFDVVLADGLAALEVAQFVPGQPSIVANSAALESELASADPPSLLTLLADCETWLAPSSASAAALAHSIEVDASLVTILPASIDLAAIDARRIGLDEQERQRRSFRIPEEAMLIVGCGSLGWEDGSDLFVQLAGRINTLVREQVHFVWVGGTCEGSDWDRLRADMQRADTPHCHFVGQTPDPFPWFAAADCFVSTAHEESLSLALLESIALGTPAVTFRNGGNAELFERAGGEAADCVIDLLDIKAMSEAIIALLSDQQKYERVRDSLSTEVRASHDANATTGGLLDAIESHVGSVRSR